MALAVASAVPKTAEATIINYDLDVVYTDGAIDFGPLSSGLAALPDTVQASFGLGPGQQGSEPAIVEFTTSSVISANISFGDGTWTENELNNFFMQVINGVITELTYGFNPITTLTVVDNPVLNFPLTITGTDIASGEDFQYTYASSTQTLTDVPEPATLVLMSVGLAGLAFRRRQVT